MLSEGSGQPGRGRSSPRSSRTPRPDDPRAAIPGAPVLPRHARDARHHPSAACHDPSAYGGLFRSRDDGATWLPANPGRIVSGAIALAVDPTDSTHLLLATDSGLLRSRNGGLDWTVEASSILVGAVFAVAFGEDGRRALASTGISLFRTEDGLAWRESPAPAGAAPARVLARAGPGRVYLAGWRGLHRSDDWGNTWRTLRRASRRARLGRRSRPGSPDIVHAVTGGQLWTSTDAGAHGGSGPRERGRPPRDRCARPGETARLWAAGTVRSTGATTGARPGGWGRDLGEPTLSVRASPSPTRAPLVLATDRGLYRADGGESWTLLVDTLPAHLEAGPLVRDPVDRATLYAGFALVPISSSGGSPPNDGRLWVGSGRRGSRAAPPSSSCSGWRRRCAPRAVPPRPAHSPARKPEAETQRIPPGRRTWTDLVGRPSDGSRPSPAPAPRRLSGRSPSAPPSSWPPGPPTGSTAPGWPAGSSSTGCWPDRHPNSGRSRPRRNGVAHDRVLGCDRRPPQRPDREDPQGQARTSSRSGWRSIPGGPPGTPTGRSGRSRASLRKEPSPPSPCRRQSPSWPVSPSPRTAPSGLRRRLPSASRVSRMGCSPGTRWARSPRPRSAWPSARTARSGARFPGRTGSCAFPPRARAELEVPTRGSQPGDVAVDSRGAVWFLEMRANKIGRYAEGRFSEFPVPGASPGLTALAVAPDGAVWFTELRAHRLGRLRDGVVTSSRSPGEMRGPLASPSTRPATSGTRTSPAGSAASPPSAPAAGSGAGPADPHPAGAAERADGRLRQHRPPVAPLRAARSARLRGGASLLGRWLSRRLLPFVLLASPRSPSRP